MSYCIYCGEKLDQEAKFCAQCGKPINNAFNSNIQPLTQGDVLKCSCCGSPISPLDAVCAYCGVKIVGKSANNYVKEFKEQLMEIEQKRDNENSNNNIWRVISSTPSNVDVQKLTLIKNFPIPNTIEEISEFMLLAVANIDVNLSKNTWRNRINSSSGISSVTISWAISNAWVAKMEQVYNKALISFPNDPIFKNIDQVYKSKMKELKLLK